MNNANLTSACVWHNILKTNFFLHTIHQWYFKTHEHLSLKTQWSTTRIKNTTIFVHNELNYAYFLFLIICNYMHKYIVCANFALCSNCGQGRARPNIQSEGKRVSEDAQPRNWQNCHPRRGWAWWWGIGPCPRTKVTSGLLSEVSGELVNHSEQRLGQIL